MSDRRRATLSGRCASGAEQGRGSLVHVLEAGTPIDDRHVDLTSVALCGATPGRRSAVGWTTPGEASRPCPRCARRAAR